MFSVLPACCRQANETDNHKLPDIAHIMIILYTRLKILLEEVNHKFHQNLGGNWQV